MATFARDRPAPVRSAAPFLALALVALAFVAAPGLPRIAAGAAALLFASAGAIRSWEAARELHRLRRAADRLILQSVDVEVFAWRTRELTAEHSRTALRREVDRTVRAASAARLPSASPLNRIAVRQNAMLLERLADRLAGEEPVTARGVLLARRLLRDPDSPLYGEYDLHLPREISRVLGALEP